MNRKGLVLFNGLKAGIISEQEDGFIFNYFREYLEIPDSEPVSLTLPLREEPYKSRVLHAFFDGLIPEGWMLVIAERNWKLNRRDRMGLLLACCGDCIGAVSVLPIE